MSGLRKLQLDLRLVPALEELHQMEQGELVDTIVKTRMAWLEAEKRFLKLQAEQSKEITRQSALLKMHERYLLIEAKRVGLAVVSDVEMDSKF